MIRKNLFFCYFEDEILLDRALHHAAHPKTYIIIFLNVNKYNNLFLYSLKGFGRYMRFLYPKQALKLTEGWKIYYQRNAISPEQKGNKER